MRGGGGRRKRKKKKMGGTTDEPTPSIIILAIDAHLLCARRGKEPRLAPDAFQKKKEANHDHRAIRSWREEGERKEIDVIGLRYLVSIHGSRSAGSETAVAGKGEAF